MAPAAAPLSRRRRALRAALLAPVCAGTLVGFLFAAAFLRSVTGLTRPVKSDGQYRTVSFAGGGFLCLYGLGAARALMHKPELAGCDASGSSIGAWVAAAFLYLRSLPTAAEREAEWQKMVRDVLEFSKRMRPSWLSLRLCFIEASARAFLRPALQRPGAFERCLQGRLHVPVLRISLVPPRLGLQFWNRFRDTAHLEEVLKAGASIPGVQDWPLRKLPALPPPGDAAVGPTLSGWGLDAGTLDNCPRLSPTGTLRVSWVAPSTAEIRPRHLFFPLRFVRPPSKSELEELLAEGYRDAEEWCSCFLKAHEVVDIVPASQSGPTVPS